MLYSYGYESRHSRSIKQSINMYILTFIIILIVTLQTIIVIVALRRIWYYIICQAIIFYIYCVVMPYMANTVYAYPRRLTCIQYNLCARFIYLHPSLLLAPAGIAVILQLLGCLKQAEVLNLSMGGLGHGPVLGQDRAVASRSHFKYVPGPPVAPLSPQIQKYKTSAITLLRKTRTCWLAKLESQ